MASEKGANRYFDSTLRQEQWHSYQTYDRKKAISEAAMMFGGLSFYRKPPKLDFAIYEQAFCLLEKQGLGTGIPDKIAAGIKSWSLDDASESYVTQGELMALPGWIDGVYFCPRALAWVKDYLVTSTIKTGRLVGRRGH